MILWFRATCNNHLGRPEQAISKKVPSPQFLHDRVVFIFRRFQMRKRFMELRVKLASLDFHGDYSKTLQSVAQLLVEKLDALPVSVHDVMLVVVLPKTPHCPFARIHDGEKLGENRTLHQRRRLRMLAI